MFSKEKNNLKWQELPFTFTENATDSVSFDLVTNCLYQGCNLSIYFGQNSEVVIIFQEPVFVMPRGQ